MVTPLLSTLAFAQPAEPYRYFVDTSLFVFANLLPDSPSFYQLNGGVRFDPANALIVEAITWRYDAPLGVQYGKHFEKPENDYPGRIRDYGIGLAYQHLWWRGLYTIAHVTPFLHEYKDEDGDLVQRGFMLWVSARVGWHLRFAHQRLFVEPSIAFNAWPIETNQPAAFADDRWPNYFLLEPGLNLGVNF